MGEGDEGEGKVVGVVRAGEGVAGEKRLSASERSSPSLLDQLCTVAENEHTAAAQMLSALSAF